MKPIRYILYLSLSLLWLIGCTAAPEATPTPTAEPTAVATAVEPVEMPVEPVDTTAPPTATLTPAPTATSVPPTATPIPTETPTPDANLPPAAGELGDSWLRPRDGMVMVYVPPPSAPLELRGGLTAPAEDYWLDKYTVTNAQYQLCVNANACEPTRFYGAPNVDDDQFNGADYPVVGVSWRDTVAYTAWLNESLPSGAVWTYALPRKEEWEYAAGAAWTIYPWGDEFDGARLNFCDRNCDQLWANSDWNDGYAYTAPVGSYLDGASWVGALDMAGNVWEWTGSWWSDDETGLALHGGSWYDSQHNVHTVARYYPPPDYRYNFVGFRLVLRRSPSHS